ncbi:MAG: class I adenylate-forming enzyme family protein, partial [Emcibacteraceae bacterium]|nr:class I adenylate-forming enzyme family protein [Emcibacteraceae bacterium]
MNNPNFSFPDTDRLMWSINTGYIPLYEFENKIKKIYSLLSSTEYSTFVINSSDVFFLSAMLFATLKINKRLIIARTAFEIDRDLWISWGAEVYLDENLNLIKLTSSPGNKNSDGIVLTTSGTTGIPKPVKYSYQKLIKKVRPKIDNQGNKRWMLTFHPASYAGLQIILTSLLAGDVLIYSHDMSVTDLVDTYIKSKPTHISGTPTYWRNFIPLVSERPTTLQQITLGGELADQNTLDLLKNTFPYTNISHIYATTEMGSLFSVKDGMAGFPVSWLGEDIDGVCMKISDHDTLMIKSNRGMESYLGQANKINLTWYDTNDSVKIINGRVIFMGRDDGVINIGGTKVHPEPIEALICSIENVIDVYIYAIKNPITGSLVAAKVMMENNDLSDQTINNIKN